MQNTITIMFPVYNSEKTVAPCIDSILCQTFTYFELLIADDGSTDDTLKIVRLSDGTLCAGSNSACKST